MQGRRPPERFPAAGPAQPNLHPSDRPTMRAAERWLQVDGQHVGIQIDLGYLADVPADQTLDIENELSVQSVLAERYCWQRHL